MNTWNAKKNLTVTDRRDVHWHVWWYNDLFVFVYFLCSIYYYLFSRETEGFQEVHIIMKFAKLVDSHEFIIVLIGTFCYVTLLTGRLFRFWSRRRPWRWIHTGSAEVITRIVIDWNGCIIRNGFARPRIWIAYHVQVGLHKMCIRASAYLIWIGNIDFMTGLSKRIKPFYVFFSFLF